MELNHDTKTINVGKFKKILDEIDDDYDIVIIEEAFYNQVNGIHINKELGIAVITYIDTNSISGNSIFINEDGNIERTFKGTNGRTESII